MRRREFITLIGAAAVAGPFTTALRATAQPTAKIPRVGILSPASSDAAATLARRGREREDSHTRRASFVVTCFRPTDVEPLRQSRRRNTRACARRRWRFKAEGWCDRIL